MTITVLDVFKVCSWSPRSRRSWVWHELAQAPRSAVAMRYRGAGAVAADIAHHVIAVGGVRSGDGARHRVGVMNGMAERPAREDSRRQSGTCGLTTAKGCGSTTGRGAGEGEARLGREAARRS